MSTPQLDELQWKSPEWIQSFGLRTDNVLDYFAESPFFDRSSNNQVAKMQHQFAQPRPEGSAREANNLDPDPHRQRILSTYMVHALWDAELRKLKGVEYVLAYVREPDFWIIRKQLRSTPTTATPLQDYFIIGANVYQSPSVFKILQSRLLSANFHLSHALSNVRRLSQFEPSQGGRFVNVANQSSSTVSHPHNTVPSSTSGPNSAANTGPATTSVQSVLTHSTTVNDALMDKLLGTSMKSTPVYL
ncbi:LAFA_0E13146g1_1 [Lachancea sp. 'fantastica']|nr:LAFA_0E13146g1_1 [Lachancea sp. 'fantastica']